MSGNYENYYINGRYVKSNIIAKDIEDAFQPFYQETSLSQEVNVDLIYKLQNELHEYNIFSDNDIEAFSNVYYSNKKQDSTMMGKMTSALKPVADRYNKMASDERYNFRRQVRSYIKWYGYISQVCRMFDAEMQKEYAFCSYLLNLLPKESVQMFDLEGALRLEFYKLEQTFKGEIGLIDQSGVYEPADSKGKAVPEAKEPLEEVIDDMVLLLRNRHTARLRQGICNVDSGLVFMETLTYMERASDQCSSIAVTMLARNNEAILHNHYDYLKEIHSLHFWLLRGLFFAL